MSIKKEIVAALRDGGTVKINNITHIDRWTIDGIGEPCDGLSITFDYVSGVRGGWTTDLKSRSYDEIIAEIECKTLEYFTMCAEACNSNLRNGYR